jgi:hypothetical protein
LEKQIEALERQLKAHPQAQQLKSLPGVGDILGATLYLESGTVERNSRISKALPF